MPSRRSSASTPRRRVGRAASLLVLGCVSWLGTGRARASTYLLAMGNNVGLSYEPALRYAEKDARQFATVMKQLGNLPPQNVVVATGESAPRLRQMIAHLDTQIRRADLSTGRRTVLIFFYSGHADARGLHLGKTLLPYRELKALVERSAAQVRIMVLDSCRSGAVTRVKGARPIKAFRVGLINRLASRGLAVITSSAAGEDSYESEKLQSSFFSHHLVTALRGAGDRDRDRRVTLSEAYSYTYHETLRASGQTLKLQHPTYSYAIRGKGEVVLTWLDRRRSHWSRLQLPGGGMYLVFEGSQDGHVTAEVMAGDKGASLVLPPGRYFVQRRGARSYHEFKITLEHGKQLDLSRVSYHTVKYARLVRKGGAPLRRVHGLYMLGGVRGKVMAGPEVTPHVVLGTSIDFPWMSLGLRGHFSSSRQDSINSTLSLRQIEAGGGLTVHRFFDLPGFSIGLGLLIDLAYHHQAFESRGTAPTKEGMSMGFGPILALEVGLWDHLVLLVEGGPQTRLFKQGITSAGTETGDELTEKVTYWAAGGLGWKF